MPRTPLVQFDVANLRDWVDAYRNHPDNPTRTFPMRSSGIANAKGWTWASIDRSLLKGVFGEHRAQRLSQWLNDAYPDERAPLTPAKLADLVEAYRRHPDNPGREFPTYHSQRPAELYPNGDGMRSWRTIHAAMVRGLNGFPERITLADWLDREYPEERGMLTRSMLRRMVAAYRDHPSNVRHEFPSVRSHQPDDWDLAGAPGFAWTSVNAAMMLRQRGFAEGLTLTAWLDREYPVERGVLSSLLVRELVEEYVADPANDTRALPTGTSGEIDVLTEVWGVPMTWARLSKMMAAGTHGFPEKITLPRWLKREFAGSAPIHSPAHGQAIRRVSPGTVRAWIDRYRCDPANPARRFPTADLSLVPGGPMVWAQVAIMMALGSRGFGERIDFEDWLDREYGLERLPLLTAGRLRYLVAFHRRHRLNTLSVYPDADSPTYPGMRESWAQIDVAMRSGTHGFPGRASLAQWIEQEYGPVPDEQSVGQASSREPDAEDSVPGASASTGGIV
ncbi:hypothetical protein [Noviherbaspirillum malthae]|uniref:hypothetical protein n=1 Tax=Noviherbaspirillum malthae TaxID=1260987 RepID=UPI001E4A04D0|nr:hypothetical protein [Noviherbaspirillum malthae]